MRVATVNLASGRDVTGESLHAGELAVAVAELDADVVAVQEVDVGQPRSHGVDQPAVVAAALGAVDWRYAATILGTPAPVPVQSWTAIEPVALRSPADAARGPRYGVALFSRRPVRRWHALGLGSGQARLPLRAPDPAGGRVRTWWFPDEPRAAIAAELDELTVIGTHLSFAPHTASWQLRRLQAWSSRFPAPVLVAGDLNLPGPLPAIITGGQRLFCGPTFPASDPKLQLDHLLSLGGLTGSGQGADPGDPRLRPVPPRHDQPAPAVRVLRHRACHPPGTHPGRHRTPDRSVADPAGAQPAHGPRRPTTIPVPDPRP